MGEIKTGKCWVCGREMLVKDGLRGRPKEAHDACREYETRKNQMYACLLRMGCTEERAKIIRGDLFNIANTAVKVAEEAPTLRLDMGEKIHNDKPEKHQPEIDWRDLLPSQDYAP